MHGMSNLISLFRSGPLDSSDDDQPLVPYQPLMLTIAFVCNIQKERDVRTYADMHCIQKNCMHAE